MKYPLHYLEVAFGHGHALRAERGREEIRPMVQSDAGAGRALANLVGEMGVRTSERGARDRPKGRDEKQMKTQALKTKMKVRTERIKRLTLAALS